MHFYYIGRGKLRRPGGFAPAAVKMPRQSVVVWREAKSQTSELRAEFANLRRAEMVWSGRKVMPRHGYMAGSNVTRRPA